MEDISTLGKIGVIGIRREDKSKWERRVPITPNIVARLMKNYPNLKFIVQPSNNRVFRNNDYIRSGAILSEDLSECSTIFGVKEIPINLLLPNKTYVYFSHTIKAQEYNMPSLDDVLKNNIRLIDYEKITDEDNRRLVAFGKFAGNAGCVEFLSGIGRYFLNLGYSTPFLNISPAYTYKNLEKCKTSLKELAEIFENEGIPKRFRPLVFGITGTGRCADGVLEILKCLPIEIIEPENIRSLVEDKNNPNHSTKIYVTILTAKHMVKPKNPQKQFSKEDYYQNPGDYVPIFHQEYLPFLSVIFHCIYWETRFPRLITNEQIKNLSLRKNLRLFGVCDITCDLEGSIEFLKGFTTIDEPFFLYNPQTGDISKNLIIPSNDILYQAIDNLPSELAYDSSTHFAEKLAPFIEKITMSDIRLDLDKQCLPPEIQRAVIAWNGNLTPLFSYINELRKSREESNPPVLSQKPNSKKKNNSIKSLKIFGHLFDTKAINQILDYLEERHINFRVLEVKIGQSSMEESSAFIQIFIKDNELLDQIQNHISRTVDKFNLKIENLHG